MAAFLYKWLFISLLISVPERISITLLWGAGGLHPFHVSTTEINHNAADKTLEISCRVFTDDFESALTKVFNVKADFSNPAIKTTMDTLVKKYINGHLQLKAERKSVSLTYIGFEKEKEAIYIYVQADNISTVKKIEAVNSILHDLYEDQINIMHVVVAGNRKSTKLDYPAKDAVFSF
jgi:hypothetical protein